MTFDGPMPTITTEEALSSDRLRLQRDIELAAWCGMDHAELGPFLDRLALFDARTRAIEEEDALMRARAAVAEREKVERWGDPDGSRYGLGALRRMLAALGQADVPSEEIERVAYACGRLVAGGELSPAVVGRSLAYAVESLVLPEDVFGPIIEQSFQRGMQRPRGAPAKAAAA